MPKYTFEAVQFCDAIRDLASKPENLQNLESYLEWSFDKWMKKYASDPTCIAAGGDVLVNGYHFSTIVQLAQKSTF